MSWLKISFLATEKLTDLDRDLIKDCFLIWPLVLMCILLTTKIRILVWIFLCLLLFWKLAIQKVLESWELVESDLTDLPVIIPFSLLWIILPWWMLNSPSLYEKLHSDYFRKKINTEVASKGADWWFLVSVIMDG